MITALVALMVLGLVLIVAALGLLVRNEQVFQFRQSIIDDMMHEATYGDAALAGEQLDAYNTVPYEVMVYKVWRPLNRHEWFAGTVLDR